MGVFGSLAGMNKGSLASSWPVESDILKQFHPDDVIVLVCRCLMFAVACFTTPLLVQPLRTSINHIIRTVCKCSSRGDSDSDSDEEGSHGETSTLTHVVQTVLIILAAFGTAISVPDLGFVVGIVGSTGAVALCTVAPGLFFMKLRKRSKELEDENAKSWKRMLPWVPVVLGTSVGLLSTTFIIKSKVSGS